MRFEKGNAVVTQQYQHRNVYFEEGRQSIYYFTDTQTYPVEDTTNNIPKSINQIGVFSYYRFCFTYFKGLTNYVLYQSTV